MVEDWILEDDFFQASGTGMILGYFPDDEEDEYLAA